MTKLGWFALAILIGACGNGVTKGKVGECFATTGQTCTGVDTYETCLFASCDTQLTACYGAGYKTGSYAGAVCESYITCINSCNCNAACTSTCTTNASAACTSCVATATSCVTATTSCTLPTCTGGYGGMLPDAASAIDAGPTFDANPFAPDANLSFPDASLVFPDANLTSPDANLSTADANLDDPCMRLKACCPRLSSDLQAGCNTVADGGLVSQCQASLATYSDTCP